jgi:hypothetical protein
MYQDKLFDLLVSYIQICPYLVKNKSCDGCPRLVSCVAEWDIICSQYEDKVIPKEESKPLIERIKAFVEN